MPQKLASKTLNSLDNNGFEAHPGAQARFHLDKQPASASSSSSWPGVRSPGSAASLSSNIYHLVINRDFRFRPKLQRSALVPVPWLILPNHPPLHHVVTSQSRKTRPRRYKTNCPVFWGPQTKQVWDIRHDSSTCIMCSSFRGPLPTHSPRMEVIHLFQVPGSCLSRHIRRGYLYRRRIALGP